MTSNNTSVIPPPPPPPLPIIITSSHLKSEVLKEDNAVNEKDINSVLQRLLHLNENFKTVFHMTNVDLKPQIQEGPKCGLVALSIASSIRKVLTNVEEIYEKALSLGYTKQGEIFNAEFLADLAEKCCGFRAELITGGLITHFRCIMQNLLNKNLLLLPYPFNAEFYRQRRQSFDNFAIESSISRYQIVKKRGEKTFVLLSPEEENSKGYDADRNHEPCCKKGYKSHWAVITGVAILSESDDTDQVRLESSISPLKSCDCKCDELAEGSFRLHFQEDCPVLSKGDGSGGKTRGKVYLVGRQGKSRHVGLWPFDEMAESNDNLMFFSVDRNRDEYVLPEGGPAEGLKGKAIILKC